MKSMAPTTDRLPVAPLDFGDLSPAARKLITDDAFAPNTHRAMASSWATWITFCSANGYCPLPADPLTVVEFIASRNLSGRKPTTISRDVSMIALRHKINMLPSPAAAPQVALALQGVRRAAADGISSPNKDGDIRTSSSVPGLNRDMIAAAMKTLAAGVATHPVGSYPRLRCLRDGALLMTAYACMLRRSELVSLVLGHVTPTRDPEAPGCMDVFVARSKTDPFGEGVTLLLPARGARWLHAWLDESGVRTDGPSAPVFRALPYRDRNRRLMPPLSDAEVPRIFKRIVGNKHVAGHSTRIGRAEDMVLQKYTLPEIMTTGRWKSSAMVAHYTRNIGLADKRLIETFRDNFIEPPA